MAARPGEQKIKATRLYHDAWQGLQGVKAGRLNERSGRRAQKEKGQDAHHKNCSVGKGEQRHRKKCMRDASSGWVRYSSR